MKRKGDAGDDIDTRIDGGVGHLPEKLNMQCFPLYSILKAIEKPSVDYLSLDVEGSEYGIMHSVFQHNNDIAFNVASIETTYLDGLLGHSWLEMQYLMRSEGYVLYKNVGEDDIFVHQKFNI